MLPINDHKKRASSRILSASKSNPDFVGLIQALEGPTQTTENLLQQLAEGMFLETAIGAQLDVLGKHLLDLRGNRNDNDYRTSLRGKWSEYIQSGEPEVLIQLYKGLTGAARVKFEDDEEHKQPFVTLSAALPGFWLKSKSENSAIYKIMKSAAQSAITLHFEIREPDCFEMGESEADFAVSGLDDLRSLYPVFELGESETDFGLGGLNEEGVSTIVSVFYDGADYTNIQTNQGPMAFYLEI